MTEIIDDILNNKETESSKEKRMTFSLQLLENQFLKMESDTNGNEEQKTKEKPAIEKFSSIPIMLKCYLCEDFCEDAVQIFCCYENFCDKHIKEEIMKNFTCPNCKAAASLKDITPNKKLREIISWFKELTSDTTINIQNQNSSLNSNGGLLINQNLMSNMNNIKNLASKPAISTTPTKENEKEINMITIANNPTPMDPSKAIFNKESLLDQKINNLKNMKKDLSFKANFHGNTLADRQNSVNFMNMQNLTNVTNEDKSQKLNNLNNNLFDNNLNLVENKNFKNTTKEKEIHSSNSSILNFPENPKNEINKIEFKKESNMTPEEKMQLYNKINSDSSQTNSQRKHSEEINENASQKGMQMNKMPMMPTQGGMGYPYHMNYMFMKPGMYDPRMYMSYMANMGMMPGMNQMAMQNMVNMMHPNMHAFQQMHEQNNNDSNDSDDSNSNSSSSSRKRKRKQKRSRSRDNKHSKNKDKDKEKEKHHKKKDHKEKKEKDRDKDKDKDKHKDKDSDKHKNKEKKDKDKEKEKLKEKEKDKDEKLKKK